MDMVIGKRLIVFFNNQVIDFIFFRIIYVVG